MTLDRATETHILALTMIGEAVGDARDGSSVEERLAVGCVVRNRLRLPGRYGDSYRRVCFAPKQFSCWNDSDPNRARLLALGYLMETGQPTLDRLADETLFLADGLVRGLILDTTVLLAGGTIAWARGKTPVATVGAHSFFVGIA